MDEATMSQLKPDPPDTDGLLEAVRRGEPQALDRLLLRHRDELRSFVEMRLDPRLGARVDPSDVV
jgi:RNA polymerase sigma-70 factor (ECF subfamily)